MGPRLLLYPTIFTGNLSWDFIGKVTRDKTSKKKGRVEAGVKYVKKAFVPLRTFRSLSDANAQLNDWVLGGRRQPHPWNHPAKAADDVRRNGKAFS